MLLHIALLTIYSITIALATALVLESLKKISALTGFNNYALANFVLAMGTSLPELSIAIQSALVNQPALSLGNVLGSNIANLSIVIGLATLIGGAVKINKNILNNGIHYTILIAAFPLILMADKQLSATDGLFLLITFCFWQITTFSNGKKKRLFTTPKNKSRHPKSNRLIPLSAKLIIGMFALLISAHYLVGSAQFLASQFGVPPLFVGIFIVGLGSSLPELMLEAKAIKNKQSEVALGDLLGSVVINSSLIIGITAFLRPFTLSQPMLYLTTSLFFFIAFGLFYLFIRTKNTLERWEGAILFMLYFILIAIDLI
jgi:cation:H+ antiporter